MIRNEFLTVTHQKDRQSLGNFIRGHGFENVDNHSTRPVTCSVFETIASVKP